MNLANINVQKFEFLFDPELRLNPKNEPVWKDQVDRWYQLDETSFALCEAVSSWKQASFPLFDELIFISEGGSNLADAEFVATVPASPAKFVYTLANIGPSVFSHLLKWSGPVYCFCAAPKNAFTLELALKLANKKLETEAKKTFILETIPGLNEHGYRAVTGYFVSSFLRE